MKPHLYRKWGFWFCRIPGEYGVFGGLDTPQEAYMQCKLYMRTKLWESYRYKPCTGLKN